MFAKFLTLVISLVIMTSISSCTVISSAQETPAVVAQPAPLTQEKASQPPAPPANTQPAVTSPRSNQTIETSSVVPKAAQPPESEPASTPPTASPKPVTTPPVNNPLESYPLGIIGEIEPVTIIPFEKPFEARIDTGATTSSIHATNIKEFERDGKKWVSFDIVNPTTKEKKSFRKRLIRVDAIVRVENNETRYFVRLDIRFGDKLLTRKFSLADRSKFKYPVLIGRNVLAGLAIVDVTRKNTLE